MSKQHTAPDLLEAVGVDCGQHYVIECPECHMQMRPNGIPQHAFKCRRPNTSHIVPTYTGPALGTPELDKELLVAGFKWMLDHGQHEARFIVQENPGHALARAIREATNG